jgi:hypothetical protein
MGPGIGLVVPQEDMAGGFAAEGDFSAVDSEDAGVAAGGGVGGEDGVAGEEAEFHEAEGEVLGEVDGIDEAGLVLLEVGEGPDGGLFGILLETELHSVPIIAPGRGGVKRGGGVRVENLLESQACPR